MYCTNCCEYEILAEGPYTTCRKAHGSPCDACNALEILNSKISEAEKLVEGLLNQRCELKSRFNQVHDVGIHQMPTEIASRIFEFHVDSVWNDGTLAFTLGAVCQKWRRIVWSTPHLWTCIWIEVNLDADRFTDLQFTKGLVDRSGQLPLSIHLVLRLGDGRSSLSASTSRQFDPFIDFVNEYSSRWGSLDLDIPRWVMNRLRASPALGAPLLDRIKICFQNDDYNRQFSIGPVKPSPKFVDITGRTSFKSLDIEWNCVTSCSVNIPIHECMELFYFALQMTECTFTGYEDEYDHKADGPLVHSKLESLRVDFPLSSYRKVDAFFDSITFPALKKLSCQTYAKYLPVDSLVSFFTRSSCRLQKTTLEGYTFTRENRGKLFTVMDPSARWDEMIVDQDPWR